MSFSFLLKTGETNVKPVPVGTAYNGQTAVLHRKNATLNSTGTVSNGKATFTIAPERVLDFSGSYTITVGADTIQSGDIDVIVAPVSGSGGTGTVDLSNYPTRTEVNSTLAGSVSGKADKTYVDSQLANKAASADLSPKANAADLKTVAFSGQFGDLIGKPDLSGFATAASLASGLSGKANVADLSSGLALKADTTALTSALASKADATALTTGLAGKANTSDLSTVIKTTDVEAVDLTVYAKTTDLTGFAKTTDLSPYAKTSDLSAYSTLTFVNYLQDRIAVLESKTSTTPPAAPAGTATRPSTLATTVQPTNWLKPESLSGADGDSISSWVGTSATAQVSTLNGGTAPKLLASAFNGRNALRFTKAAVSKMTWGPASGAVATNQTIFIVARHPNLANAGFLIHGENATSGVDAAARMAIRATVTSAGIASTGPFGATGATFSTMGTAITANTWNIFCLDFTTGSLPTIYVNGVAGSTGVGSTDTAATLTTLALGGYGTGSGDIDYVEILRFGSGQLSAADRSTAFQYLATTHNITVAA